MRYMERDASELRAAGAAAEEPRDAMQEMFVQVSTGATLQGWFR